jgi:hypothetical protein
MATGKPKVTLPKKSIQPGPSRLVAGVRVMPKAKSSKPRTIMEMPERVARPKPRSEAGKQMDVLTNKSGVGRPRSKATLTRKQVIAKSMKTNPNAELSVLQRGVAMKNQARRNASQAAISSVKSQRDAAMKQLEIKRMRDKLKGK